MEDMKYLHPSFQHKHYLIRRKVFKLFGGAFHVYDEQDNLVLYSKQKAFKIREDFRIYSDENQSQELLTIKTPQILDLAATYYVHDAATKEVLGSIKRKGLKSLIRDEWIIFSSDGHEIGKMTEANMLGAILSRFINLIPQNYCVLAGDNEVAHIKQHFNPFILKYTLTLSQSEAIIDPRILIAAGILLAGIERRQS